MKNYFLILTYLISSFLLSGTAIVDSIASLPIDKKREKALFLLRAHFHDADSSQFQIALGELLTYAKKNHYPDLEAIVYYYRGHFYAWHANNLDKGIVYQEKALETAIHHKLYKLEAGFMNQLGRLYLRKDPAKGFEYLLRSDRMLQKIGYDNMGYPSIPDVGANYLYNIALGYSYFENNQKALFYLEESLPLMDSLSSMKPHVYGFIGKLYEKMENYEQALHFYTIAQEIAQKIEDTSTTGSLAGSIGHIYLLTGQYEKARPMIEEDFRISKLYKNKLSLTGALIMSTYLSLKTGDIDSASQSIHEIYQLIKDRSIHEYGEYWQHYYDLKAQLLRQKGELRQALLYQDSLIELQKQLSAEKDVNIITGIETLLLTEKHLNDIALYEKEKSRQRIIRNTSWLILFLIVLLLSGVITNLKSRQKRQRQKQQILLLEKQKANEQIRSYREKLHYYIDGIRQKNQLIEDLQQQIEQQMPEVNDMARGRVLERLYESVILTEDDWIEFKRLFELTHPGFLYKLQTKYPDLTTAEIRLAVFMKLNFSPSEISNTLGISPASVRQTRNRLRKKLELSSSKEIIRLVTELGDFNPD